MATSLTKRGLIAASDKVIIAARPALEMVRLFTTDFSTDAAKPGQVVSCKVMSATAADFAKGTQNFVKGTNAIKYADIRLTKHKISSYQLDDLDVLDDELAPCFANFAPTSGAAISKEIVKAIMDLLTYSSAAAQKAVTGTGLAKFAGIRALVEAENLDPADCVLVLEPVTYADLITALPASVIGNGGVVNTGIVGALLGFKAVIEAPNATKVSGAASGGSTPSKGIGFVVPSGAVGIAARYYAPIKGVGGELLEAGETTDDETGLVFGTRVVQNAADGEVTWSVNALFGAALMKQTISGEANGAPGYLQLVTA